MKILIAGSRTLHPDNWAWAAESLINIIRADCPDKGYELITGTAQGIDQIPYKIHGWVTEFPADWDTHGKKAGGIRNAEMAEYCDAAIIIWDGESPGTKNMIANMNRVKKPYILYKVENNNG